MSLTSWDRYDPLTWVDMRTMWSDWRCGNRHPNGFTTALRLVFGCGTTCPASHMQKLIPTSQVLHHGQCRRQASPADRHFEWTRRAFRVRLSRQELKCIITAWLTQRQPWNRLAQLHSRQLARDCGNGIRRNQDGRFHCPDSLLAHVLLHLGNISHPYPLSWILQRPHR